MIRINARTEPLSINFAAHPDIQRSGWDPQKLRRLVRLAKTMAINFEAMTRGQVKPNIVLTHQELGKDSVVELNAETSDIYISLKAGPEPVFEEMPLALTTEMVDLLFKPGRNISRLPFVIIPDHNLLLALGAKSIIQYFKHVRGFNFKDEAKFVSLFVHTATRSGEKVAKQKLAFNLLDACPLPKKEIVNEMGKSLAEIRRAISDPATDISRFSVWETIATLASLSVVAARIGCPEISARCRSVLSGETGQQLAAIDFTKLSSYSGPSSQAYACAADYQLKTAVGGFHLTFDAFHRIFEFYYDRVEVV